LASECCGRGAVRSRSMSIGDIVLQKEWWVFTMMCICILITKVRGFMMSIINNVLWEYMFLGSWPSCIWITFLYIRLPSSSMVRE
jgi:hypothetical protein